ncbi:MAG: hypothetical protein ACT4O1_10955 [Gemmatimonadota bacterium]
MRRSTLLCFAVLALACAQTDEQANAPADTVAAAPAAPAAISLADVGRSVARYDVSAPDSVLIVRTRGMRNP